VGIPRAAPCLRLVAGALPVDQAGMARPARHLARLRRPIRGPDVAPALMVVPTGRSSVGARRRGPRCPGAGGDCREAAAGAGARRASQEPCIAQSLSEGVRLTDNAVNASTKSRRCRTSRRLSSSSRLRHVRTMTASARSSFSKSVACRLGGVVRLSILFRRHRSPRADVPSAWSPAGTHWSKRPSRRRFARVG
jgi:hypothetical protein